MKKIYKYKSLLESENSETIKRIIASIAKLIRQLLISGQLPQDLPLECLSRMMGNYLVRFLGGDGACLSINCN